MLPVSFRRAGKVAMRFRASLNRHLLPFRYPSGILPVSFRRAGKMIISQLNGSVNPQESLDGPYGTSLNGSANGSLSGCLLPFRYPSGILPVSFRRAGKVACTYINVSQRAHFLYSGLMYSAIYYIYIYIVHQNCKSNNPF